jgi:hypothetical protein
VRLHNEKKGKLFLTVLEAGKSKIKVPADLVPGKELAHSWYFLIWQKEQRG